MANQRDDKHPFPSKYNPGQWMTPAQWLTERLFEKRAQIDRESLPIRFWSLPKWKKDYIGQVQAAAKLLQDFTLDEIMLGVNSPQGKKVLSFRLKWFRELIKRLKQSKDIVRETKQENVLTITDAKPLPMRKPFVSNHSILSKLKEYDGKKEGRDDCGK